MVRSPRFYSVIWVGRLCSSAACCSFLFDQSETEKLLAHHVCTDSQLRPQNEEELMFYKKLRWNDFDQGKGDSWLLLCLKDWDLKTYCSDGILTDYSKNQSQSQDIIHISFFLQCCLVKELTIGSRCKFFIICLTGVWERSGFLE